VKEHPLLCFTKSEKYVFVLAINFRKLTSECSRRLLNRQNVRTSLAVFSLIKHSIFVHKINIPHVVTVTNPKFNDHQSLREFGYRIYKKAQLRYKHYWPWRLRHSSRYSNSLWPRRHGVESMVWEKRLVPPNLFTPALVPTHPPPTNTGTLLGDKTSGA